MSITVHQILNDAKRLVNRLREHDTTAQNIITQTQTVYKNVESMKEYCEDVADQNVANQIHSSRPLFIFNVQQENKHICELQQENQQLRQMLEEHQSVLELIMSKYRYQITKLVRETATGTEEDTSPDMEQLQMQADSICQLADVMKKSIKLDEDCYINEQKQMTQLITENRGLRELLEISRSSGSLFSPIYSYETADKEVQTDAT